MANPMDYNDEEHSLYSQAEQLEQQAKELRQKAVDLRSNRVVAEKSVFERLTYAAYDRCSCGYGMAYDPLGKVIHYPDEGPFHKPNRWECAATLLYSAGELPLEELNYLKTVGHSSPLPFTLYEIKSENQPSANGATTREPDISKR